MHCVAQRDWAETAGGRTGLGAAWGWVRARGRLSHNSEPEFEITKVLDLKIDHQHSKCKLLYLVHWTRYAGTDEEMSWILALELRNAPELISDFHQSYPAKPGPLGQL